MMGLTREARQSTCPPSFVLPLGDSIWPPQLAGRQEKFLATENAGRRSWPLDAEGSRLQWRHELEQNGPGFRVAGMARSLLSHEKLVGRSPGLYRAV
jgi:hypothetical protein